MSRGERERFQFPMGISGFGDKPWPNSRPILRELFQFPMGISGFGDGLLQKEFDGTYDSFNSLWELAGLVTYFQHTEGMGELKFQFPMGISGFGDP